MATAKLRAYTSATLVLLALDWADGKNFRDFLGFAVRRSPGFRGARSSWLTNRIDFNGPAPNGLFYPSNKAPIQKFLWWDAQIDDADRGKAFDYEVWPVRGDPKNFKLVEEAKAKLHVRLPQFTEDGIGTWFNRAVVSSQAFSRLIKRVGVQPGKKPTPAQELRLRAWLANGLETVVPEFLKTSAGVEGAIYHLQDTLWVLPALEQRRKATEIVYDARQVYDDHVKKPSPNEKFVKALKKANDQLSFRKRTKTNIMHNKILIDTKGATDGTRVLCGSANFTTGGLTTQANLLHVFESAALAKVYRERVNFLKSDPAKAATAKLARWSKPVSIGKAKVSVCFSPEKQASKSKKAPKGGGRISMSPILTAIKNAKSSVLFCLFTPTDKELRDACFAAGDRGLMMYGLVNRNREPDADSVADAKVPGALRADKLAQVEIYDRSRRGRDVVGAEHFSKESLPAGFLGELKTFPGTSPGGKIPPVIIHHKFIVIDAETANPTIFSGSANMSNNAQYNNDENLLMITGSRQVAEVYLAEFLRLFEQYRARAAWLRRKPARAGQPNTYRLTPDARWAKNDYAPGTPKARARQAMVR